MTAEFKTLKEYLEKYGESNGVFRAMFDYSADYSEDGEAIWKEINEYMG